MKMPKCKIKYSENKIENREKKFTSFSQSRTKTTPRLIYYLNEK